MIFHPKWPIFLFLNRIVIKRISPFKREKPPVAIGGLRCVQREPCGFLRWAFFQKVHLDGHLFPDYAPLRLGPLSLSLFSRSASLAGLASGKTLDKDVEKSQPCSQLEEFIWSRQQQQDDDSRIPPSLSLPHLPPRA